VNAAEILFLAIGLCLGVAVGAALLDLIRARPAPREVRLTITHNALPEREAAIDLEHAPLVERVPIRVARGVDPAYAAIRQGDEPAMVGAVAVSAAAAKRSGDAGTMSEGRTAVAMADDEGTMEPGAGSAVAGAPGPGRGAAFDADDPCAAQRRLADERCAVAAHANEQADAAATNLRNAKRAYDDVARRMDEAHERTDPRAVAPRRSRPAGFQE
jgi:hypothetical protein